MKEIVSNKMLFYNEKTGQREPVDLLRGESAYEAAVRLGQTTLSEEEWLQEYNANKDAAISAINARQAEATQAVASAGATQINSIAAKGAETLATIPEDYAKLSSDVTTLTEEIVALKAEGSKEKITVKITDGVITNGYYTSAGNFAESSKAATTDYIPINGRELVTYYTFMAAGNYIVTFFDAGKALITSGSVKAVSGATIKQEGTVEIPDGAQYVRLSSYSNDTAYMTIYSKEGSLSDKRVAVLGDSISSVDYTLPNYWQKIAERTGCTFVNYGVSASRIASSEGAIASPFIARYVDMSTDVDAVIIMGGTNDANNSQLGEWASADTVTLYGALNTMLPDLCVRYPGKPIIFFAPIRGKGETLTALPATYADLAEKAATDTLNLAFVRLAIKAKCEQYGIPYIETDKISGINGNDAEGIYYIDALHPSAHGVACLANVVQAELEKRFVYTVD